MIKTPNSKNKYNLNLIKETNEDYKKYNHDYLKPCKLYYKIGDKVFKCNFCLEFNPTKFNK